jgi:outer membrane protein TolC
MKKLIFIILLSATVISAQSRDLTLKESLKVGLEKSKSIKISKSKLISSKEKVFELKSQMLPILSFAAGYARLSSIPSFEVSVPFSPAPITLQDPVLNNYGIQLSVKQALFTGFRLSSLKKAAEFNSLALENEYQKEINEDALKIHTAFWNFYKANKLATLLKENLKSIKNQFPLD